MFGRGGLKPGETDAQAFKRITSESFNAGGMIGVGLMGLDALRVGWKAHRQHKSILREEWKYNKYSIFGGLASLVFPNPAEAFNEIMLAPLALGAAQFTYQMAQNEIYHVRKVSTPFSHRFEHTDVTWQAQQRGMAAINRAESFIGSEAGAMARRYGRG